MKDQLAPWLLFALVLVSVGLLLLLWKALSILERAWRDARRWRPAPAAAGRPRLPEVGELFPPRPAGRVYKDVEAARARYEPPTVSPTAPVQRRSEVVDPIRTETTAPEPPEAAATTRHLRAVGAGSPRTRFDEEV